MISSLAVASAPLDGPAPRYRGPRVAEAPDTGTAITAAVRQGSPVAISELTTGDRLVHAQPDGTLEAELSPRTVRVRQGDRWVAADPALVRRADGTLAPRAADADLTFSGGGTGTPLVRYGRGGKSIALSWPGRLPVPTVDGASATYAEVLPGVDLVMRADVDGYLQHLVIKSAAAARNPALSRIRLALAATGVTVRAKESGALEARDAGGAVVFAAPPSAMWDSGTATAVARVAVDPGALTLSPDRRLLDDPATRFPVTVDPNWDSPARTAWAKVFSGYSNQPYWFGGIDGGEAKVGLCWPSTACNGIGKARSYFQYDTGFLAGKQILSAALNTTITYSPSCQSRDLRAFLADRPIDGGTTWNNAPWGAELEVRSAGVAYTNCAGYKPLGFNATARLRPGGVSTYFIAAVDEADGYAWRKLDPNATNLVVNFNTRPNAPYELGTDPPLPKPCRWCAGKSYVGDQSIRLKTRLSDPDNDLVRPRWDITGGGATEHRDWGPNQISGAAFSTDVDLRNRNGQTVSWTVWADDGTSGGPVGTGPGPFVVDQVGVAQQPGVSAPLYREDNRWHGGVGVPDQFTFDAAGVADIDHYLYGWQDPPSTSVDATALGGPATVTLAPSGDGPRDLYVQSVDRAGHRSPTRVYHFYVRAGNGPYAQWPLEGSTEDTAFLGDRDGTLTGGATYGAGAVGTGLKFDGGPGVVTAPNAVRTDTSFSVSAWVRLDAGGFARAAVSQDGTAFAGFDLWYRPENGGKWVFGLPLADSGAAGADMAWSAAPAQLGVWTQLTGIYDAPRKQLKLYVDGVLSGTATRTANPWHAGGSVRVGQTLWNGALVDNWVGSVDEVQLYDRVVTDAEVAAAVSRDNVQVGYWRFDDEVGTTTAVNAVAGGEMAVLATGATLVADGAVKGAVRFDGTQGYATTNKPAFRTDQSFSVAAWVNLSDRNVPRAVLSQDGTNAAGFGLWYRPENGGRWVFAMPQSDGTAAASDLVSSSVPAETGVWTHLVGVYDAPARQLRIYVKGTLAGTATRTVTSWNATGPFQIGRGRWNGEPAANYWAGAIDEVRAYSRVISAAEIQGLVSQSNVTAGNWKFDGDAVDSSGQGRNGTPGGTADWAGGQTTSPNPGDLALHLDGATGYVSAPHAVDTSTSFAAAAWVRLDRVGGHYGVVSQDGNTTSAFKVEADPGGGWSFTMFTQDVNGGGEAHRAIGGAAQPGVWTHVAGVYDAGNQRLNLYVNGVLAASTAHAGAWNNATGKVQIGRNKWNGGPIDYLPGAIDDVTLYSRALFADEIRAMAGRDLSLVHNWALDESTGTNAADAVGSRRGTLSGGAGFAPGRVGNAVRLDGVDDAVSTSGLDLSTAQSFTVSSWVYLTGKDCDLDEYSACKTNAVTVDGQNTSKFRLGHVIDDDQHMRGSWMFEMPESDAANAAVTKAVVATEPADLDRWVHLAGVYDAATRKVWLYVDGTRVGDGTLNNPWSAGGGLQLGRGKGGGTASTQYRNWPGGIDDVRLYTGVLDSERVYGLYRSYPAQQGAETLPTADAGSWRFDEGAGTTVADASGRGRTATLRGGTGWVGGRSGNAAWLDGTSGYAETAGPVLTTSASFSVTAWAYLTRGGGTTNMTVVGQDGVRVSSFAVVYNAGNNRWSVVVPRTDQDNASGTVLSSTETAVVGAWTNLAVVYDATLRQLRLYVNGMLSAAQVGVSTWNATGPFTIGRGKWNGANATFFPRGIDDVRAYPRALSDGEVRRVHDDGGTPVMGAWRFDDGTGRDYTSRHPDAAVAGGASYPVGVGGTALQLDGSTGEALVGEPVVDMRDSFTVSAWARLSRTDQLATLVGQDGSRMSGFVLQYRPALQRWVFGGPTEDADSAELVYVPSLLPPKVNEWTHLTGVYDYAARQLRLYVDGKLAGSRANVALWAATGTFSIGRGKFNGALTDHFPGAVDELMIFQGAVSDDRTAVRAGWPAPAGGQLGSFVNAAGDHYTGSTDAPIRDGYHFEATLGMLLPSQRDNTRTLYACQAGADGFTSADPACEGKTTVGEIGSVYATPPTNVATIPVYRCNTGPDHFESRRADCGGATNEMVLGHALAYAPLTRYRYSYEATDHMSVADGTPPGYVAEGAAGLVSLVEQPGTQQLLSCLAGTDEFPSLLANCEGQRVRGVTGQIWSAAPTDQESRAIYRCQFGNEHFVSLEDDCEGQTVEARLGYVLAQVPDLLPIFPEAVPTVD
ncbi:LamG domain-containing protein [Micromonospora sp. NPDC049559]|uniref:LamG domain-containing protein n=1 Tax=Micromonospora sp. NPDC049559 TaxID=3155923 RepID=UPI00343544CE